MALKRETYPILTICSGLGLLLLPHGDSTLVVKNVVVVPEMVLEMVAVMGLETVVVMVAETVLVEIALLLDAATDLLPLAAVVICLLARMIAETEIVVTEIETEITMTADDPAVQATETEIVKIETAEMTIEIPLLPMEKTAKVRSLLMVTSKWNGTTEADTRISRFPCSCSRRARHC